jgi:hypothetical protein
LFPLEQKRLLEEKEVQTAQLIQITLDTNTEKQDKINEGAQKLEHVLKSKDRQPTKSGVSKSNPHKREVEPMDTSASCDLIDFDDASKMKKPSTNTATNKQSLNGGIHYQNMKKELPVTEPFDDDETQDFSLPDDNHNQAISSLREQTLLESMSPTY